MTKIPDYTIRPLTSADGKQAAALWTLVFGDEEPLVLEFFRCFAGQAPFGLCAEHHGQIAAAAYCPPGADLVEADGTVHPGAYLYAVATHPEHRKQGLARTLCRGLKDMAWAKGMEYLFTKPSQPSLYPWYEEAIGAVPLLGCRTAELSPAGSSHLPVEALSPEAYLDLRDRALAGQPHVRQSRAWLDYEHQLHLRYGGGFYAVGPYIADLYQEGDRLVLNELLPQTDAPQVQAVCTALMARLQARSCRCTLPGGTEAYVSVTANQQPLPRENLWFGPCFG